PAVSRATPRDGVLESFDPHYIGAYCPPLRAGCASRRTDIPSGGRYTIRRMARGFESKQVEAQQEEAQRKRRPLGPDLSPEEKLVRERRRSLELARTHAASDLTSASAPAHRRLLEQTIAAIDAQLEALTRLS